MTDHLFEDDAESDRPAAPGGVLAGLAERLGDERERWGLWTPVGVGAGVVLYFCLHSEPPGWLGVAVLAAALLVLALGREKPGALALG
ncbi:MAG: hypothetical protein WCJ64_27055, partial [Rhodospirillaceae bacterium]